MNRTVIAAALLLAATAGARATSLDNYRDLIRPHGHARSDAVFDTALDACYAATGASRFRPDTPAFKRCMLGRGYRWKSVQHLPEPRARASEPSYQPDPSPVEPPQVVPPTLVIDPMTGEVLAQ
jgi:hypothetical protein